nr:MAG TPA: hypothetical protein [Caudoviricetes sp.]
MNLKSRNHRVVLLTIGYPVPYTVFGQTYPLGRGLRTLLNP